MSLLEKAIDQSIATLESLRTLNGPFDAAAKVMVESLQSGHKMLICGNGGSAADSFHFATELLCRFVDDRRALPAISLAADGGFLTAAGNDYGFAEIFSRQVEGLGQPGDVLVGISTSGKSPNIVSALQAARNRGLKTIALLGRDGGDAAGMADVAVTVPHFETARIQEGHGLLIHAFCAAIERELFGFWQDSE